MIANEGSTHILGGKRYAIFLDISASRADAGPAPAQLTSDDRLINMHHAPVWAARPAERYSLPCPLLAHCQSNRPLDMS